MKTEIKLPKPRYEGDTSIEEALLKRKSTRNYKGNLTMEEISQLLWAAQGITSTRTAPSAGATYPLEIYLVVGDVDDLGKGVYTYLPREHSLIKILDGDIRRELADACLGQAFVEEAAVDIIFAAVYERTTRRYGERGIRYVHMEIGHAAQNVYLQAVSLNLGTVVVGAFYDERVKEIMEIEKMGKMGKIEEPLYIMPVGSQ